MPSINYLIFEAVSRILNSVAPILARKQPARSVARSVKKKQFANVKEYIDEHGNALADTMRRVWVSSAHPHSGAFKIVLLRTCLG